MILRHVVFEKKLLVGFLLFRVVVNNTAVEFRYAFELVGMIVCYLKFVVENYCFEMLDYF